MANSPPISSPTYLTNLTMTEGISFSYKFDGRLFTDSDGDSLTLSARQQLLGALPSWLSFNSSTLTFSGIAPVNSDDLLITITATDPSGLSDNANFTIYTQQLGDGQPGSTLTGGSSDDLLVGTSVKEIFIGGNGADTISGGGGDDSIYGGAGNDYVTLGLPAGDVLADSVETLIGSSESDIINLPNGSGSSITVSAVEILYGGYVAGVFDAVTLSASSTISISSIESLVGSSGVDTVTLMYKGASITISGIETLIGDGSRAAEDGASNRDDWVNLSNLGNTITLSGIETLVGSANTDVVTLNAAITMALSAIETLTGSSGGDWINLRTGGNTLAISRVETLIGGANVDVVTLGAATTMALTAIEALAGSSGGDWVYLGNRGNTMNVSSIETLVGGANTDLIALSSRGNTMILTAIETLTGGSGADVVALGNRGNTMSVTGVETVTGGISIDRITVSSGAIAFQGNGGADAVALVSGNGADTLTFATSGDGGAAGTASGWDEVYNFQTGTDRIFIAGSLRSLVDQNGDGILAATSGGASGANLAVDDLIGLTTTVSSLADSDFTSFRTALGSLTTDGAARSALVLAHDNSSSGLYLVSDTGNGLIAGGEVRLLARFNSSLLATGDVSFA